MVRHWSDLVFKDHRCWAKSLLLNFRNEVLVEPFLLLSDESFLECHLDLILPTVGEELHAVLVFHHSARLHIVGLNLLLTLNGLLAEPLIDLADVVFGKVAQNLLLEIFVVVTE